MIFNNIPERRLSPPEPPEPIVNCWYCNEGLYPDMENNILIVKDGRKEFPCCGRNKCLEAIGLELEWNKYYEVMNDNYTFADYVNDRGMVYQHIPTEEEMELLKAEI